MSPPKTWFFLIPFPEAIDPVAAITLQNNLGPLVETEDRLPPSIDTIAGIDVGFVENGQVARAAIAVLQANNLQLITQAIAYRPVIFPYRPGLLSFQEIPAILDALEKLAKLPDLLLCDGQGIAHPRRLGIATHLGLTIDRPSIGVAKTRLFGQHGSVPNVKGAWVPLTHGEALIGAVLRTRVNTKPLYISSGHRVSLKTAINWVLHATTRYRLPETTRWAHALASQTALAKPLLFHF